MNLLEEIDRLNPNPALREAVLASLSQVDSLTQQLDSAHSRLKHANLRIQALNLELAHHRRIKFGVKSESLTAEQRDLFEETWCEDGGAIEAAVEQLKPEVATEKRKERARAGRQPLPDHLPRIEHRHEPASCQCGQCGAHLVKIGEDITEQLDVIPAQFFVHRHIRSKYACRACETIQTEPVPPAC